MGQIALYEFFPLYGKYHEAEMITVTVKPLSKGQFGDNIPL